MTASSKRSGASQGTSDRASGVSESARDRLGDIANGRDTKQALQASRTKLEAALASMTDAVFISDTEGRFIDFNQAFATFHKFANKEACATTLAEYPEFLEVYFADGMPAPLDQWAVPRALRGETETNAEYLLRRKDTGEFWVGSYSFAPIRDEAGAIVGAVVVGRDITEQKRTEEALRASEARYKLVSENGSDVIWLFDLALNRFTYVSPSVARLRGYSVEEVLNQSMSEALTPDSLELVTSGLPARLAAFESGDESARSQTLEVDQPHKNGGVVHTEVVTTFIAGFEGRVTHIQGVTRDITDRKRAEVAFRESEERFRAVVDSAPDAIFIQTGDRFRYVNPAVLRLFGATRSEELVGELVLDHFHPDFRERIRERIRRLNIEYEPQSAAEQVCLTITGEPRNVEVCAVPFRYNNEDGALVFARDVTARKKADAEREHVRAQLLQSQKMESVGRLAGGIAHDFNNLLSVILNYVDFAMEAVPREGSYYDLAEVKSAAQRAAALTRQLLAFSRKQVLQPEVVPINEATTALAKMLQRIIGEDIRLTLSLSEHVGAVKIDRGQLEQVLMNLATNSRDAMPQGGALRIETTTVSIPEDKSDLTGSLRPGCYIQLAVIDSGCGIADDTRSHIFDPFFTTKPTGQGTGLGLSMVYGIVQQSGGHIAVESKVGQGTCFRIYLPVVSVDATPECEPESRRRGSVGTETVLVVEDERGVRKMVKRILSSAGYSVLVAESGNEAIRLCEQHQGKIDVILTDVVMPDMNGRQLAARALALMPGARVLFMSGYTGEAIAHHGVLDPEMDFIAKPFDAEELKVKLREIIERQLG